MITLQTEVGSFGPFVSAAAEGAGWLCDGIFYPEVVVGKGLLVHDAPPPEIPTVPPPVPTQCSMLAARTVLYKAGLLGQVEAVLAAMEGEDGDLARIKWTTALTVRRDDPLVVQVIPALGKSEAEIDAMFVAAVALDQIT